MQVFVELITDKIALEKDFLVMKSLKLTRAVTYSLSKDPKTDTKQLLKMPVMQEAFINQTKWTLFLVKDRTSAQKVSPKLVIKAFKTLNEQLNFFSIEAMRESKLVDMIYPGLASIATKAITDDYKCNLKTKLVMLSLWRDATQVQILTFKSSLVRYRDATQDESKEQRSLAFKSLIKLN